MTKIASRPAPDWSPGMKVISKSSLTAAAGPVSIGAPTDPNSWKGGTAQNGGEAWQSEAWAFFNCVSELRYVCSWLQNALSRCTLVPSDINPETGQPTGETSDQLLAQTITDIAGGPAGQSQLLGQLATFLTVPGEGYIAIILRPGDDLALEEQWYVLSTNEVQKKAGGTVEITLPDGEKYELNDDTDTIARVYRPHPQNAQMADSPVRANIPNLREIVRLGQWVEATAKSRLAGNGIFVIPNEISLPKSVTPEAAAPPSDPDAPGLPPVVPSALDQPTIRYDEAAGPSEVMEALIDAGGTAIDNPDTASALLPLVMQGPGDWIDKMQHITFSTDFTEVVIKLREAATKRLALGLDVPSEILLGTGDMNHWSAWQVEESAIKLHVEPLLTLICDAITEYILRPLLELQGHPNPDSVMVWYSTVGLTMRPNRASDAKDAYDRRAINADTYRREIGYDDADAIKVPSTDDERFALALQLMEKDSSYAKVVAELAGIDLPEPAANPFDPYGADPNAPVESTGDADQKDRDQPIPDTKEDDDVARIAAVNMALVAAVHRRMEIAGKRMRTRSNLTALQGVSAAETHLHLATPKNIGQLLDGGTDYDQQMCAVVGLDDVLHFSRLVTAKASTLLAEKKPITNLDMSSSARRLCRPSKPSLNRVQ